MAALTVEPLPVLMVEHLKVLISRAPKGSIYLLGGGGLWSSLLAHPLMAALMVEHLKVLISRAPKGPYGRAPKG